MSFDKIFEDLGPNQPLEPPNPFEPSEPWNPGKRRPMPKRPFEVTLREIRYDYQN